MKGTRPYKHVLLYSGGMDSYIAYWYLREEKKIPNEDILLLYVPLGHKYQHEEYAVVQKSYELFPLDTHLFVDHGTLELGRLEEPSAYIPLRNSFLAHVASFHADNIWLISQKGETNLGDRSIRGFKLMGETLTHLYDDGRTVTVDSPFWTMTKVDMVRWYKKAGLSIENLKKTHACYHPVGKQGCGKCSACFRRWMAMSLNDISEDYAVNPWETETAKEYLERGVQGFYGWGRDEEILEALRKVGIEHATNSDNV
jgi:7-cyano-7-deazaguanine synthase